MAMVVYAQKPQRTFGEQAIGAVSWVRDYVTAIKHGRWHPYTPTERKARAATRNEAWGPTGTQLNDLAEMSADAVDASIIFAMLELRLGYPPNKWRNVYKALTVLEFLVRRGSDACVARATEELGPKLDALSTGFAYTSPSGRDMGVNVRHRAAALQALLADKPRLASERAACAAKAGAYVGYDRGQSLNTGAQAGELGAADGLRAAGETKGVSQEESARCLAALKRLLARPHNRACADCGGSAGGSGDRPSWACLTARVFLCLRCAGLHRGLGVHVSVVRSCTLDTWLPAQVEALARAGGNTAANAYWEARLQEPRPELRTLAELESFVRRKYADRAFVDEAAPWPPPDGAPVDAETAAVLADLAAAAAEGHAALASLGSPAGMVKLSYTAGPKPAEPEPELAPEREPVAAAAPPPPPPPVVNLMDLDIEPEEGSSRGSSPRPPRPDLASDPMRCLEELFAQADVAEAQQPQQETPEQQAAQQAVPGGATWPYHPPWAPGLPPAGPLPAWLAQPSPAPSPARAPVPARAPRPAPATAHEAKAAALLLDGLDSFTRQSSRVVAAGAAPPPPAMVPMKAMRRASTSGIDLSANGSASARQQPPAALPAASAVVWF